ncbi:MAG: hypothetical protein JRH20_21440 [Deltaproteobacteria bacterium]|nr:hypothetical protein [Deltaproteobacteria bacterium]
MIRSHHVLMLVLTSSCLFACAHVDGAKNEHILPLKRLHLYETGVGYFERSGMLQGGTRATLPLPAGHIDDALKTLTLVAKNGEATVSGVSFSSNLSRGMARALAGLEPAGKGAVSFRSVILGLRGQAVQLRTKEHSMSGAVIDLTQEAVPVACTLGKSKKPPRPCAKQKRWVLLFLHSDTKIQKILLSEVISIRPEGALRKRIQTALTALTKSGRQKRRALELLSQAKGAITLGYIAETALFRVSYRLFAQRGSEQQTLQGWALVHNDSDEDWRQVQLSFVSGRPDSFLFPLTVPRYLRRPLVHPKRALPSVPQLINTTPDAIWGDQLQGDEVGEAYGMGGLGISGHGRGGGGSARGTIGLGRMGTLGSSQLRVGNLAAFSKAKASKLGTLFRYQMRSALDLRAHHSALVPFSQLKLQTKRITLIHGFGGKPRATALVENSTGQTIPPGTISFFSEGSFVGESFLPRTKPGQRHFLQHGTDLDVELKSLETQSMEVPKRLTYVKGGFKEHFIRTRKIKVSIENRDSEKRSVYFQPSVTRNASIKGADALDFDMKAQRACVIFYLGKNMKVKKTFTIEEGLSRRVNAQKVRMETLDKFIAAKSLSAPTRALMAKLKEMRVDARKHLEQQRRNTNKKRALKQKLGRLRNHLKAVGGKAGNAVAPFVRRILAVEDALSANQKRAQKLEDGTKAQRLAMEALVKGLGR